MVRVGFIFSILLLFGLLAYWHIEETNRINLGYRQELIANGSFKLIFVDYVSQGKSGMFIYTLRHIPTGVTYFLTEAGDLEPAKVVVKSINPSSSSEEFSQRLAF